MHTHRHTHTVKMSFFFLNRKSLSLLNSAPVLIKDYYIQFGIGILRFKGKITDQSHNKGRTSVFNLSWPRIWVPPGYSNIPIYILSPPPGWTCATSSSVPSSSSISSNAKKPQIFVSTIMSSHLWMEINGAFYPAKARHAHTDVHVKSQPTGSSPT